MHLCYYDYIVYFINIISVNNIYYSRIKIFMKNLKLNEINGVHKTTHARACMLTNKMYTLSK